MAQEIKRKHFILVHGLCHGAWCWYKISPLLQKAGHRVTAVDLAACGTHPSGLDELHSFTDYTEPLTRTMVSIPPGEKVIIVKHSFGGLSVSLAMEKFSEKISVAVFAAAVMTCVENPKLFISEVFSHSREIYMDCKMKEKQESPNQLSSIEFGPEYMSNKLYQNCPIEDLELAKLLVRPGTQFKDDKIYEKMITKEKYGQVPRVYIVCRDDRIAPEQFQKWMIEQSPGTEVMEIAGADHMVMLSKPTELFNVLQEIANKYS
ncbi:putative esterase PIR7A [Carex littledalei]|uniref:Putative esterase PIR7A n=1 Tax=Carex littledalei TaxID=544730 RepID=A0A833VU65_9POAL|nr:putative esterase PIR7A [Carex littledalei]